MVEHTHLSLFHKILICVEDRGKISLADLGQFGSSRQMLGALGRLEGLGYIERTKEDTTDYFKLTEHGDDVLASILDYIPQSQDWDKKWRLILFDIPESRRTVRQAYRLKLIDIGARMLQSSVWITPYASVVERFLSDIDDSEFRSAVQVFHATVHDEQAIDVRKLWNLDTLEKEYKELFANFRKEKTLLKKSTQPSFDAKCLIVALALTMKKDPFLPTQYMPSNWIGYEGAQWHAEFRQFCR